MILPVKIFAGDVEFDSRYITSVSHDEMFVVTYFSTKIEESTGVLTVALPYTSLEPIKQKLTSTVSHDEQKASFSWMSTLKNISPLLMPTSVWNWKEKGHCPRSAEYENRRSSSFESVHWR